MENGEQEASNATFAARLTPHRSLGPRGFVVLMSAVCVVSFAAGFAFWLIGAWPVFFFFGLDVLLVYWAFRANYAAAKAWEQIEVAPGRLTVERQLPRRAPRSWTFHPYWVRVELDEHDDLVGALRLRSHGRSLEIAAFLSPGERKAFAEALREALAQHRSQTA